ncbi:MAG: hypothetical protein JW787_04180 [Sedimentisphaerales bacterium]|nr:hypothetical protein [Sedimentisphaerales bacterium]
MLDRKSERTLSCLSSLVSRCVEADVEGVSPSNRWQNARDTITSHG